MKKVIMQVTLMLVLFLFSVDAFAELPSNLLQGLYPSKGFLIKVAGDSLLIDLDSTKGVREGDIFTILSPGEQITHPITKKIVAVLEEKVGIIKVVAVKDGYSIAQRISGTREVREGFKVGKFSELKVLYLDYAANPKLYDEFRKTFQTMEWETYGKGIALKPAEPARITGLAGYDLYVVSQRGKITLYDGRLDRIREYAVAESEVKPILRNSPQEERPAAKVGGSMKTEAEKYRNLFRINEIIRCMDGKKIGGIPYYLLATDEEVLLYRYENSQMRKLAAVRDFEGEPVAVFLEDMDNNGSHEIVIDSYQDGTGYTTVYSIDGERVNKTSGSLPFLTALYDTDGDGMRETKLIQFIEGDNFWGRIEKVSYRSGAFGKSAESVPVPKNFHILGGFIADIDGDGNLESGYYSPSGKMLIYRGDKHLWTSSGALGGSMISVPYRVGKGEFTQTLYEIINQSPAVINVDGEKRNEVVMMKNEAGYSIIASHPGYSGGYISSLGKIETGFKVSNLTERIEAVVQNVVLMGNEIIFTKVDGGSFSSKGETYVLSFPIK